MHVEGQKVQVFKPTTGQTITVLQQDRDIIHVAIKPLSALAAVTIAIPPPRDGQKFLFTSPQPITLINVSGTTMPLFNTLSANAGISVVWSAAENEWFKF